MAYVNVIKNGGAPNTTDWTNPTNGLAQYWTAVADTKSIVTGGGFIGNAQRLETIVTTTDKKFFAILQEDTDFISGSPTSGGYGNVSFKYRSNNPELSYFSVWGTFNGSYGLIGTFTNNSGTNQISISFNFDWSDGALENIVFGRWNTTNWMPNGTYYLEIDEVTVIADSSPISPSQIQVNSNWENINYGGSKVYVDGVWKSVIGVQEYINGVWKTVY